eukprot:TRINITY_DN891_c0_g6_i1.p1 TRINITY_DN891_c0_g6~~TRINITY_DN891_c0_g6_i1.p1  ORF type:complete len:243 (-),score=88.62 TRINITY_DN891_c0_g6_i1:190-918(-)
MAEARMKEAQEWMESVLGSPFPGDFHESLKSGVLLCELLNKLKPGTIPKINKNKMAFMQMENISAYIECSREMGVPDHYNFVTVDLFEAKDLNAVALNILTLKRELGYGLSDASRKPQATVNPDDDQSTDLASGRDRHHEEQRVFAEGLARTGASHRAGVGHVDATQQTAICPNCSNRITSGVVRAVGESWHHKCFECKQCGRNLVQAKFYENDGKAYCDRCILIVNPQTTVSAQTVERGLF